MVIGGGDQLGADPRQCSFKEVLIMFFLVSYYKPKSLIPWDDVRYLQTNLQELTDKESEAVAYSDVQEALSDAKHFQHLLGKGHSDWKPHIIVLW
jgi:hypothetical protein